MKIEKKFDPSEATTEQLESIGIFYDKKGAMKFNETLFATHICEKYKFVLAAGQRIFFYQGGVYCYVDELDLRRQVFTYFNDCTCDAWSMNYENRYIAAIYRVCPKADALTPGVDFINVENGLFHIGDDQWRLAEHSPDVFTTTRIPVRIDKNSTCPLFTEFLNDTLDESVNLIRLVQEVMGYALCDHTLAQKLVGFKGSGANGKSVLCNVIEALVGSENVSHVSMAAFKSSFELAGIVGKRLNISTENSSCCLDTDILKKVAAGEGIQINEKYGIPYSYTPTCKLIFAMNQLPYTKDTSHGFARRLILIPFNKTYSHSPRAGQGLIDPLLTEKLLGELDGILIFALKGLRRLQKNRYRFTEAAESQAALTNFLASINPYVDFINAVLCFDSDSTVSKRDVYLEFLDWVQQVGFHRYSNISARSFYEGLKNSLTDVGIPFGERKIHGGIRVFSGFTLNRNVLGSLAWDTTPDPVDLSLIE